MNENVNMDAYYDSKGHRIDTRMPVAQNAVPEKVMHRVSERYPGHEYRFVKIDRRGKKDLYMVRFKEHSKYRTFYVDNRGREMSYSG